MAEKRFGNARNWNGLCTGRLFCWNLRLSINAVGILHEPRLTEFIRLFNEQAFFESHEILEELWLECSGDRKQFYQGLIKCAVALAHCQRNNRTGATQVGARALAILKTFGTQREGILVGQLVEDCEKFLSSQKTDFPLITLVP
jgi:predicted metal-dependent hydrolase